MWKKILSTVTSLDRVTLLFGALLLVLLTLGLTYCAGRSDGQRSVQAKYESEERKLIERQIAASETMAVEALEAEAKYALEQEELRYACENSPDAADCRVRRGCFILRQQGADTSGIAACVRVGVGTGAGVSHFGPD